MINLLINFISPAIQSAMLCYYVLKLSKIFNNTNNPYTKIQIIITIILLSVNPYISVLFGNSINSALKCIVFSIIPFIVLKFILKNNIIKSILITIITYFCFAITELFAGIIISFIFKCEVFDILNNPKLLISLIFLQMGILLIIMKVLLTLLSTSSKFQFIKESQSYNQISNLILIIIICILPKLLIRISNNYNYSTTFLIASVIETIVMVILTFIFFKRTLERDKAQSELNLSEMHNKTMVGMVDGVRTLKHDYNNIIQALSGYVKTKQYDKLEEHINKVLQECNVVNNFSMITPETFNEPAVYGIMGAKYFIAADKEITVDLDVSCDFKKISFPMPEFSRILGILLDNAIEATQKSNKKYIRFEAKYDLRKNADIIKVINTYDTNINIDLNKIYEKGFSSKKVKSGIGLWEVKKLVKKNKNSQIYATIENGKFVQNLIIERLIEFQKFQNTTIENNKENMLIPLNK